MHWRQFDASEEKGVKAVVEEAVSKYGRLDIYFANAGVLGTHDVVTETAVESFERTLRVNVVRYVICYSPYV